MTHLFLRGAGLVAPHGEPVSTLWLMLGLTPEGKPFRHNPGAGQIFHAKTGDISTGGLQLLPVQD
ncbi:MAG: hypothetical protein ABW026_18285 [Microvirga sp.]